MYMLFTNTVHVAKKHVRQNAVKYIRQLQASLINFETIILSNNCENQEIIETKNP